MTASSCRHWFIRGTRTVIHAQLQRFAERIRTLKTRDVSHVGDHVQPRRPSHLWTNGESILFCINTSPSVPTWQFDKSSKGCAVQEDPASFALQQGRYDKFRQDCTVHALTRMVCRVGRKLPSLRLVQCAKVNSQFFNFCVGEINFLEQVTAITSMCTHDRKTLGERKHRDFLWS